MLSITFQPLHFSVPPSSYFRTPFRVAICIRTESKTSGIQSLLNANFVRSLFSTLGVNYLFKEQPMGSPLFRFFFFLTGTPGNSCAEHHSLFHIHFPAQRCLRSYSQRAWQDRRNCEFAIFSANAADLRGRGRSICERSLIRRATSTSVEKEAQAILRTALFAGF